LNIFNIEPDYDLSIMKKNQDLFDVTSGILLKLRSILIEFRPDILIVHGDTTSAMAGALAAFYSQVKIVHVEAGLRTGNLKAPWPEEFNRKFISLVSDLHFAPTDKARENLLEENVDSRKIFITGNTVIDALLVIKERLSNDFHTKVALDEKYGINKTKNLILVTGHRRENFGAGFEGIISAILALSKRKDVQIIYPVHLNPNVTGPVKSLLSNISNISLIDPVDYVSFVHLMERSKVILTDSGGIQEEAPSLGKPVFVLRHETERPEAVLAGCVKLVGTDSEEIQREVSLILDDANAYEMMAKAINPYGDGLAAERIISHLENFVH
jgi:UDP-N-acetylglucosamine 2-epimerase (non-hydrolysing)